MNPIPPVTACGYVTFEIIGFDRVQFVSDVLAAVSGPEPSRIAHASFDADGVRSTGRLTVQLTNRQQLAQIDLRLQLVRGLIRVTRHAHP